VLVVLDDPGGEAVLEQVPDALVALVEPLGVDAVDPVERPGNCLHRALEDRVEVVRHEAVGMHLDLVLRHHAVEENEQEPVVLSVPKDQAPVDPAGRDVEDPVRGKHATRDTRHARRLLRQRSAVIVCCGHDGGLSPAVAF
jgi:hypothetical protein